MYITRIKIEHVFPALVKNGTSDINYGTHQLLWKLFPNNGEKVRDFLFYREENGKSLPQFLMVSKTKPVGITGLCIDVKTYAPKIVKGETFTFSLKANPTIARKTGIKGKRSIVHDVWMDAKIKARIALEKESNFKSASASQRFLYQACERETKNWLKRQGFLHGFRTLTGDISIHGYTKNHIHKSNAKVIHYSSLYYKGNLTVTDPTKFITMLYNGVGRSKAFGCGLMLVKRS